MEDAVSADRNSLNQRVEAVKRQETELDNRADDLRNLSKTLDDEKTRMREESDGLVEERASVEKEVRAMMMFLFSPTVFLPPSYKMIFPVLTLSYLLLPTVDRARKARSGARRTDDESGKEIGRCQRGYPTDQGRDEEGKEASRKGRRRANRERSCAEGTLPEARCIRDRPKAEGCRKSSTNGNDCLRAVRTGSLYRKIPRGSQSCPSSVRRVRSSSCRRGTALHRSESEPRTRRSQA